NIFLAWQDNLACCVIFINYGYAQVIWFTMVKNLPPTTSAMSIMMVPVTGVLSATFLIHEIPHWQDWASILFVCLAIASSLLLPGNPKRT
ncbi:MAG: EamA family transporter, partial [Gammaproteobacteria bacterium]|nr:EamA family transporter [Gammaproteobacteria bacterium]